MMYVASLLFHCNFIILLCICNLVCEKTIVHACRYVAVANDSCSCFISQFV